MKNTLTALALSILLFGCTTQSDLRRNAELQTVDLRDGVNKEEADILAKEYFRKNGVICGALGNAMDAGEYWDVPTFIGVAPVPGNPIKIEKATGNISWDRSMPARRLNE